MWLHSLKAAQLLRSAACLHTNQSRSYLNHLVHNRFLRNQPKDIILIQLITVSIFTHFSYKINFIIVFLSTPRPLTYCNSCRYFDEVRILVRARAFPLPQKLQPQSETHRMGTKRLSLEVKWTGRETNRFPPYNTDVNNEFKQFIHFLYIPLWCVQGYFCLHIFD